MKDFFVSYNRADKVWADGIGEWLISAGYTVVLQSTDFVPGSNFVSAMHNGLQVTRRTLAVLSPDYLGAPFPESEWTAAFSGDPTGKNRTLITVRIRDCQPTGLLKPIVYIDLVGLDYPNARSRFLNEIEAAIKGSRTLRVAAALDPKPSRPTPSSAGGFSQNIVGDGNVQVGGDWVENKKVINRNVVQPDDRHISDADAQNIKELVNQLAEISVHSRQKSSQGVWYTRLYRRFQVTSYKLIRAEDGPAAISTLRQWIAQERPKLRRKAPDVYRKQVFTSVWAKARELGWTKDQVYEFAAKVLKLGTPIASLTELSNLRVKKLYNAIIRLSA